MLECALPAPEGKGLIVVTEVTPQSSPPLAKTDEKPADQKKPGFEKSTPQSPENDKEDAWRKVAEDAYLRYTQAGTRKTTESPAVALTNLEIAGSQKEAPKAAPALTPEALKLYADELHEAINKKGGLFGISNSPEVKRIIDLLDSLNAADRARIEELYKTAKGNTDRHSLRDELKKKLDGDDWRKAESILNRSDGRSNDAGNLMVALSAINDDRSKGERRVLETFATLNSEQMKELEADFKKHYNMTIDEALKKFDVSKDGMKALEFLRKPVDQRSPADIEAFARFAVEKKNLDFLAVALRGETPAAGEARQKLQKDEGFKKNLVDAFKPEQDGSFLSGLKKAADVVLGPVDEIVSGLWNGDLSWGKVVGGIPIVEAFGDLIKAVDAKKEDLDLMSALDILREGRVSLATIALNNSGSFLGMFDNKDNIKLAVSNASESEQKAFKLGYEISQSGKTPTGKEEQNALEFYNRLHKAFEKSGNAKELATWEDQLLHKGGSLISKLVQAGDRNDRMAAVENISQKDWQELTNKESGAKFRRDLEAFVTETVADQTERQKLLELIKGKAEAATYQDSLKVRRSVVDVVTDNKGSRFLGLGTDYDGAKITSSIMNLTEADARKYKSEPAFRQQVDRAVDESLEGAEKVLAHRLLRQVSDSGQPPKPGPVERVLQNAVDKAKPKEALSSIETLLADPETRKRLAGDQSKLSAEDRELRRVIDSTMIDAVMNASQLRRPLGDYQKELWQTGRLAADLKVELELKNKSFYEEAARVSPEERQRLFDKSKLSAEEKTLINKLVEQGGKSTLADQIRSFVLGDGTSYEDFKEPLSKLTNEQKQQLKEEYARKYGAMDDDFLGKVDAKDRNTFRALLTPSETDGRQDFYDNLERALHSKSGMAPDATELTMERALGNQATLLQDFQARFQKLPDDVKAQANKYFADAIKDYQQSKEQFAEKLYQAAVLVGGLGVAIGTGGAALPVVLAAAAVAAAGRIALKKAVIGNDYELNLENCLKDAAIGAATGALSVVGPETIASIAGIGRTAAMSFTGAVARTSLKEGAEKIVARGLDDIVARAVVRGEPITEQALQGLAKKVAAEGVDPNTLMPALKASVEKGGRQVVDRTVKNSFAGLREMAAFGTVGGTSNVGIEAAVGLANGNLDISRLPEAFAAGFVIGSGLTVAFKGVVAGARPIMARITRGVDGAPHISTTNGETITANVTHTDGTTSQIQIDGNGTRLPAEAKELHVPGRSVDSIHTEDLVQRTSTDGPAPEGDGPLKAREGEVRGREGEVRGSEGEVRGREGGGGKGAEKLRALEGLESAEPQTVIIGELKVDDRAMAGTIFDKMQKAAGDRPVAVGVEVPARHQADIDLFMQGKLSLDELTAKVGDEYRPLIEAAGQRRESGLRLIAVGDDVKATGPEYQKRVLQRVEAARAKARAHAEKEPHVALWLGKADAGQLSKDYPASFTKKDVGIEDARPSDRRVQGHTEKERVSISEREKLLAKDVSELSRPDVISEDDFVGLVRRFENPDDKNIAAEIIEQSTPNMHQYAKPNTANVKATESAPYPSVDVQLRNVFEQIQKREGGNVSELTVVVAKEADIGKALGYLQRTAVKDLKVNIKVLDEATIANGISPTRPVLMFGDATGLSPAQLGLLQKLPKLYVTNLNGFEKGLNMFDMAAARVSGSTGEMAAKLDKLVAQVKEIQATPEFRLEFEDAFPTLKGLDRARKWNEHAVRKAMQLDESSVNADLPRAHVINPDTQLKRNGKPDRVRMQTREEQIGALYRDQIAAPRAEEKDIESFLRYMADDKQLDPRQRAMALEMLKEGVHFNSYARQLEQMSVLHKKLIDSLPPGKSVSDIRILTQMEDSSSADLIHSLYARQNGLKQENFLSVKEFQAHPEKYKDKVLVLMDDASYSGAQTEKLLFEPPVPGDPHPTMEAIRKSGADFRIAYLGEYLDVSKQLENFPPDFRPQIISAQKMEQYFDPDNLARRFGITREEAERISGGSGYRRSGDRTVLSATVHPYVSHPQNNVEILRNFIARVYKHDLNLHGMRGGKEAKLKNPPVERKPGVWHGGSPNDAKHLAEILDTSKADIVIDLRGADPIETAKIASERDWFAAAKPGRARDIVNIPVPIELPLPGTPRYDQFLDQIHQFETLMAAAKTQGKTVYFHCHWGQDRTGLMRALHEVLSEGKPSNKALADWVKLSNGDESFRNLYDEDTFQQIILDYRLRHPA